jgi:hypothetical protein
MARGCRNGLATLLSGERAQLVIGRILASTPTGTGSRTVLMSDGTEGQSGTGVQQEISRNALSKEK